MSDQTYQKWMAQVEELRGLRIGNVMKIDRLIEDAAYLKGLDLDERADIIHGLMRIRAAWVAGRKSPE